MTEKNYNYKACDLTLPMHLKNAIDRYVEHGADPGEFLHNCLANDLQGAFSHADPFSITLLPVIVKYIYNKIPLNCWGSHETVRKWGGISKYIEEQDNGKNS